MQETTVEAGIIAGVLRALAMETAKQRGPLPMPTDLDLEAGRALLPIIGTGDFARFMQAPENELSGALFLMKAFIDAARDEPEVVIARLPSDSGTLAAISAAVAWIAERPCPTLQ